MTLRATTTEDDLTAAGTPRVVRMAGAMLLMAGVFGVLHVVQLYGIITSIRGSFALVPHLMAVETAAAVVAGLALARARAWAPWTALAAAWFLAATTSVWFFFALGNGLFTLFGMLVPGMAMLAFVFAIIAKGPCEATSRARQRLEREGLELGV